jgi:hypothetical protein
VKSIKYPDLWHKLIKLNRISDYEVIYKRIERGYSQEDAIKIPILGRENKIIIIKTKEIELHWKRKQDFQKVKYYENEQEIERQILFDKRQLTYSLDELSEQEKQLLN